MVERETPRILLLGLGNVLLCDDGVGVHVVRAMGERDSAGQIAARVRLRDGGTIGLGLLPDIEDSSALIVFDAMELGAAPGTVETFQGGEMDARLSRAKRTAHEVSLVDLMSAARLTGRAPARRALVAIQPGSTDWGLAPTEPVLAAVPTACAAALSLLEAWRDAG